MIDLLLPFYGDPALLHLAVTSVLDQTDPRWRLRVIDDHYPDADAAAWVAEIDDPRVTLERNPTNLGVSANFVHCLSRAEADYLAFLGCDDVLGPTYVADVLGGFDRHPGAAIVQPAVRVIDASGAPARSTTDWVKRRLSPDVVRETVLSGEPLACSLLHGNWLYFPAIAWNRNLIAQRSFRPGMETVLDLDLILSLVLDGHDVVLLENISFEYRRHARSASAVAARSTRRFEEEDLLFTRTAEACARLGWSRAARAARWHLTSRLHAALLAPSAMFHRDVPTTRRLLRHALARPLH